MTIEEKRVAIKKYCNTEHPCICSEPVMCPLYNIQGCNCYNASATDEEIENNYNILFGGTKVNTDTVNHPSHYNEGMECIDEMILIFGKTTVANFCLCNAWKYRYRALYKNGEEDMKKSHWYIAKYKELVEDEWTELKF